MCVPSVSGVCAYLTCRETSREETGIIAGRFEFIIFQEDLELFFFLFFSKNSIISTLKIHLNRYISIYFFVQSNFFKFEKVSKLIWNRVKRAFETFPVTENFYEIVDLKRWVDRNFSRRESPRVKRGKRRLHLLREPCSFLQLVKGLYDRYGLCRLPFVNGKL